MRSFVGALAHAVAEKLGVPGERHFLETLLRAEDDGQRRQKIISVGTPAANVDDALTEWFEGEVTVTAEEAALSGGPLCGADGRPGGAARPGSQSSRTRTTDAGASVGGDESPRAEPALRRGVSSAGATPAAPPGPRWQPACSPEDAGVGDRRDGASDGAVHPVRMATGGGRGSGVAGPGGGPGRSRDDVGQDEQEESDPVLRREIGHWGEAWVARVRLKQEMLAAYPAAEVRDVEDGVIVLQAGTQVARIQWLNHAVEQGQPYDIVVDEAGQQRYIEVKASRRRDTQWFQVTGPEWRCAGHVADRYWIYIVWGAGEQGPDYARIRDPVGEWTAGRLEGFPLRLKVWPGGGG